MRNVIIAAFLAAFINGATAVVSIIVEKQVVELSEIAQATWVVIILGAGVQFAKDMLATFKQSPPQ